MLREIPNLRQTDPGTRRRWFQSDFFDLFTWQDPANEFVGMQLCYDLRRKERALTWKRDIGFAHDGVDGGEGGGPDGRGRGATPLLVASRIYDPEKINARFMKESSDLDIEVRKFVLSKLHEYAITGTTVRAGSPRRNVRRDPWQMRPEEAKTTGNEPPLGDAGEPAREGGNQGAKDDANGAKN